MKLYLVLGWEHWVEDYEHEIRSILQRHGN